MAQQNEQDPAAAQTFSMQEMKNACSTFVNHPKSVYTKMVSVEKRQEYLIQIQNYYEGHATNSETLMKKCVENMSSWDIHSICVFYLYVAVETKLTNEMENNEYIKEVINVLKSVLHAMPNSRPQIEYLEQRLNPNSVLGATATTTQTQTQRQPQTQPNTETTAYINSSENQEHSESNSNLSQSIPLENSLSTSTPVPPTNQTEPPIEKISLVGEENPNVLSPSPAQNQLEEETEEVKTETLSPTTPNQQEQKNEAENPNTPK